MPAFHSATADQKNALRSGGFAGEVRFAVNPNTIVFQATVNQTITNSSFIAFDWDNALSGSYTDVVAGMTFFITATTTAAELRTPLLRGRVSRALTGAVFYCNESAINLTDGMIVTVIANFEILQKDRIENLVDGWQPFEDLAPLVKNMQSFYYFEDATSGQFSFAPAVQIMAEGAAFASCHWTIAGATYDVGDDDTLNITVTVPYGHTWAYLNVADDNGTVGNFIFEILVCERDDPAFMFTAHDNVTINGGVETGWNVTTSFFAGVEGLLNRTRCAIVAFDVPKEGATDLFNPVVFVGYIVQENTDIAGDAASSTLSQTQFELQSFAAIAGQLPVPSLPVRNDATPDAWGDMDLPTPQRTIAYLLTRYSTLATLCAIDVLYTDSTWFAGEMDLEEGTLLDSVNRIGQEIQARLVFFPQGDATYEIDADFLSTAERNALPTLLASGNLEAQDLFGYSLPIPYYKTAGQVQAGCATFYTNGATPYKLDALAPATARQEGNEKPVVLAQLLPANLSKADAVTAARQRVGDLLEYLNPPTNLPTTYKDGWRVLTPSTRVWHTYDLPATDSTRGLPVSPTKRWLLQSVALTWNIDNGSWDVTGTVRLETRGGLAQTKATISPNTVDTSLPVLPGLPDYDAFVPDESLNYTSVDPLDIDRQPYSPFDLAQYTPMTTESAAKAADNLPGPTCQVISPPVKFNSAATRTTTVPTVNGQKYAVYVKGIGRTGPGPSGTTTTCVDFTTGKYGWDIFERYFPNYGAWDTTGWRKGTLPDGTGDRIGVELDLSGVTVRSVTVTLNEPYTGRVMLAPQPYQTGISTETKVVSAVTSVTFLTPGGLTTGVAINIFSATPVSTLSPTLRLIGICYEADDEDIELQGDAFYEGPEDGSADWELYSGGRGLLINGSPLAVPPPRNESGEYAFEVIGDGNVIPFTYYDTSYTDNGNQILYIAVCGPGMGS